jgi:succinate dehydrogenase/fumarate reductase flavoprotein subunit
MRFALTSTLIFHYLFRKKIEFSMFTGDTYTGSMKKGTFMQKLFDVIVVGGGGSGLATAVSAAQNGASVIVFEKRPELGGTTGIAIGSFTANRTVYQRKEGIEDNPDNHEKDAGLFGPLEIQARNNSRMRRFLLEHSADSLDWLMEMGMSFYGPNPEPPNRVPRMHNVIPNAKAYIAILQSRFIALEGTIMCNALVEDLVQEAGGVTGVRVRIEGKTTAFAAGGVSINTSFQVLDADGQSIEGLYAVGSNGLSGMVLWGHGLHIAWAITSGRMLGELLSRAQNS